MNTNFSLFNMLYVLVYKSLGIPKFLSASFLPQQI